MTDLLVNDVEPRKQYAVFAIDVKDYSFGFRYFEPVDIKVYRTPVGTIPDPNANIQTLNIDYTITPYYDPLGRNIGGKITELVDLSIGDIITIERDIPIDRLTDYSVGGDFTGKSFNTQLDKLTMIEQQIETQLKRKGLTYRVTELLNEGQTVIPKLKAGEFWKANGAGDIAAVTQEENPDWSTLRTELASDTETAPGAELVGFYDAVLGLFNTTVDQMLKKLANEVYIFPNIHPIIATFLKYEGNYEEAPEGWIWMRDLTIGDAGSGSTERANADTQSLFVFLWDRIVDDYAPIYNSAGVKVPRGASAIEDFNAHRRLSIPRSAGRAMACAGQGADLTGRPLAGYDGNEKYKQIASDAFPHKHLQGMGSEVFKYGSHPTLKSEGPLIDKPPGENRPLIYTQTVPTTAQTAMPLIQPTFFVNFIIKL